MAVRVGLAVVHGEAHEPPRGPPFSCTCGERVAPDEVALVEAHPALHARLERAERRSTCPGPRAGTPSPAASTRARGSRSRRARAARRPRAAGRRCDAGTRSGGAARSRARRRRRGASPAPAPTPTCRSRLLKNGNASREQSASGHGGQQLARVGSGEREHAVAGADVVEAHRAVVREVRLEPGLVVVLGRGGRDHVAALVGQPRHGHVALDPAPRGAHLRERDPADLARAARSRTGGRGSASAPGPLSSNLAKLVWSSTPTAVAHRAALLADRSSASWRGGSCTPRARRRRASNHCGRSQPKRMPYTAPRSERRSYSGPVLSGRATSRSS